MSLVELEQGAVTTTDNTGIEVAVTKEDITNSRKCSNNPTERQDRWIMEHCKYKRVICGEGHSMTTQDHIRE